MSSIEEKVIAEIRERARKGEAKYGTTMDRTDLSIKEWMQHLKEELLDGVIYTQKIIEYLNLIDACDTESNTLYIEEE